MSIEKKIIVTAALDPSFEKVKTEISQLVSQITQLGEAFNRVNMNIGGGGGGGGFTLGGKTGGGPGGGGTLAPAAHQAATAAANASLGGNNVANSLARSVQGMSQIFQVAKEQGTGAMKIMSDALKRNVDDNERQIERLSRSLEKLDRHYKVLQERGAKGGIVGAQIQSVQDQFNERAGQLAQAKQQRAQLLNQQFEQSSLMGEPDDDYYGSYNVETRRPWKQRLKSFFGGESAVGGIRGEANTLLKRGLGYLGVGAMGGVAGTIGAGFAGWQFGQGMMKDYQQANLGLQLEQPMWASQRQAAFGQIYGGNASAINRGDFARALMMGKIADEGDYHKIVGEDYARNLKAVTAMSTPTGFVESAASGKTWDYIKKKAGSVLGGEWNTGIENGKNAQEIERMKAMNALTTKQAEAAQQYLEQSLQRDPMLMGLINKVGNSGLSNMSLARSAGVSGGMRNIGGQNYDSLKLMEARANASGYDVGEWVGMMQQIAGTAGRGLMHSRTGTMLSAQHGGLQNAVQLYGLGAQYMGGGDAGGMRLFDAVQSITGKGGLDPLAASQLTATASGMITNPAFQNSNPDAFFRTVGAAASTGSVGGDMRMARNVAGGLGIYGNMMSGGIDPLQQAYNASAAISAAPNASYYTHQGLMKLDPASLISTLKGGAKGMPDWMKYRGISFDMVKDYSKNMMSTMFGRLVEGEAKDLDMGKAAGRFMKSGGIGYMKGMKKSERDAEIKKLTEGLVAQGFGERGDVEGFLRTYAAQEGVISDVHGKGAHQSASISSVHGESARAAARFAGDEAQRIGKEEGNLRTSMRTALEAQKMSETQRKVTQQMGRRDDADGAIADIQAALSNFVSAIRREIHDAKGTQGVAKAQAPGTP